MGSLRYIKHRRRGENWQAYKCYRGFIEQLANAHAASNSPHSIYKELDIQGNDEILKLFFAGDIHEKERKYYEFIKNRAENERLLPGFSRDLQEIWENYLDGWNQFVSDTYRFKIKPLYRMPIFKNLRQIVLTVEVRYAKLLRYQLTKI